MIALTATSFMTILPLGSVHFALLCQNLHDFSHGIFCYTTAIMTGTTAEGISASDFYSDYSLICSS
jgi:hypothetical protein